MAVDDQQVIRLIKKSMAKYSGKTGGIVTDLAAATGDIIDERRGICDNYEYAAADHYLNMRTVVAQNGQVMALVLVPAILIYDFVKVMDVAHKAIRGKKLMKGTDGDRCPPTDPNWGVMQWALRGISDGLSDFNLIHGRISRHLL